MNREIKIDAGRIFHAWREKWWVIVIVTMLCLAVSSILTNDAGENGFSATTTVYSMSYTSLDDSLTGSSAISAYANVITSRKVAEGAKNLLSDTYELSAKDIQKMIASDVSVDNNAAATSKSQIISITAYSAESDTAIAVANAVANSFVNEMQNMTGQNNVQILDEAQNTTLYRDALKEQIKKRIIGTLLGLLFSMIVIALIEMFSTRVYRVEDASLDGKLEILAIIPNYDEE